MPKSNYCKKGTETMNSENKFYENSKSRQLSEIYNLITLELEERMKVFKIISHKFF